MSRDYEQTATTIVRENYRLRGSYTHDMINEIAAALRAEHLATLREAREALAAAQTHARPAQDVGRSVRAIDRLIADAEKGSETDGDE